MARAFSASGIPTNARTGGAAGPAARLACALAVAVLLLAGVAGSHAGELSLASYNTHGLHRWISRDEPEIRFPVIGDRLRARYDVALMQEVFVADYHRRLAFDDGWLLFRGNGPRPGPLGLLAWCDACGSGLAAAVRKPLSVLAVAAEPFGTPCAGKIRGAHDCWATKGLLFLRLRLAGGEEVDLYDLHLDAGDRGADFRARRGQIARLRREIDGRSAGRAVVVAGDFNLKQDVQRDRELLEGFRRDLGLADTGARPTAERWDEVVDYILYRSGGGVALAVLEAGEAREFVDSASAPLSDHPALFVRFGVGAAKE